MLPEANFALHPEFARWVNEQAERVASLVQDLTGESLDRGVTPLPGEPDIAVTARIGREKILEEVTQAQTDLVGTLITPIL